MEFLDCVKELSKSSIRFPRIVFPTAVFAADRGHGRFHDFDYEPELSLSVRRQWDGSREKWGKVRRK
jgi:hypothetical protein